MTIRMIHQYSDGLYITIPTILTKEQIVRVQESKSLIYIKLNTGNPNILHSKCDVTKSELRVLRKWCKENDIKIHRVNDVFRYRGKWI